MLPTWPFIGHHDDDTRTSITELVAVLISLDRKPPAGTAAGLRSASCAIQVLRDSSGETRAYIDATSRRSVTGSRTIGRAIAREGRNVSLSDGYSGDCCQKSDVESHVLRRSAEGNAEWVDAARLADEVGWRISYLIGSPLNDI